MNDGAASTAFERHVESVIAALVAGEVVSYGDVADVAGFPGRARAVGALLARSGGRLPWWRVVLADGRLTDASPAEQTARLRAEGVTVRGERVRSSPSGRFSRSAPRQAPSPLRRRTSVP